MATKVVRYSDKELHGKMEVISPTGDDIIADGNILANSFVLDGGTGMELLGDDGSTLPINTVKHYTGYCDTAGAVAEKDITLDDITGFILSNGVKMLINFINANTIASAITLQVDNLTAYKPLYYPNGTAVSGSLAAGIYELEYYNNAWYILNGNASSGGGSNTDISYANGTLSKTVNGTTSDVVTAANIVKDGLTVGTAAGSGNVISEVSKNASTGELEVTKGVTAITDVVYNASSKKLQKKVGTNTTDIVTLNDLLYTYGEVRRHEPVYVNPASLSTLGSLDALFISECPTIFLKKEPLYDTIIVTPFSDTSTVLDFSNITYFFFKEEKELSLNRIHIYIMYSKTGLTIRGAVVNNPLTVSGSPSDPGVVMNNTCKLECYFNIVYGYWFVEVTSMGFVKGSYLSLDDYNEIIKAN